ncbi:MAG: gspH [Solimicrobium sp.]|nr:gspH [Solimicrobium sp.]MCE3254199.1 gspH [Cellvibrio sp.]
MGFNSTNSTKKLLGASKKNRGFTLLELLVVLVVVGIMLGLVSLNSIPSKQQALQGDAQRIALLLQLAREEAIVRNSQVAFEVDSERYRFYVRSNNEWKLLNDNDLFRERSYKNAPLAITIYPNLKQKELPLQIIFGREPVDKPFTLTLASGGIAVSIVADGIGHFTVE